MNGIRADPRFVGLLAVVVCCNREDDTIRHIYRASGSGRCRGMD